MSFAAHRSAVFSAPAERCQRLNGIVLNYLHADKAVSILDIGCGTGAQILSLARELPLAELIGVDISVPNIRIAENRRAASDDADRIAFHNCNYLDFKPARQIDVILTYSTLYLIPVPDALLFGKIASELAPGGLFINVMPTDCAYNSALTGLRRCLRAVRGPTMDHLIFSIARLIHGRSIPRNELRERVAYMYEIPQRFDGPKLQHLLDKEFGLESVQKLPEIHASPAQMKHSVHVFRKRTVVD
jgi:2-polyprenyl-3-methyl-5-hydroxy-6-metoxy-1,4-benzoquinol methylase